MIETGDTSEGRPTHRRDSLEDYRYSEMTLKSEKLNRQSTSSTSLAESEDIDSLENSSIEKIYSSSKKVHWDPEVHETVHKKPERVRSRDQADGDEVVWWSNSDEFHFRRERDYCVLAILRENPYETRHHLRQFSLFERRSAANEHISRLLKAANDDSLPASRSSSFSTGSASSEESLIRKIDHVRVVITRNQLTEAWIAIQRLIQSRGRGLKRR